MRQLSYLIQLIKYLRIIVSSIYRIHITINTKNLIPKNVKKIYENIYLMWGIWNSPRLRGKIES